MGGRKLAAQKMQKRTHTVSKPHKAEPLIDSYRKRRPYKRGKESLTVWRNLKKELLAVKTSLGHVPTWTDLENLKRYDILSAVRSHGGMHEVKKKMGWKASKINPPPEENEKLKDKQYLISRFNLLVRNRKGAIPTYDKLAEEDGVLLSRIRSVFGGYTNFKKQLGLKTRKLGADSLSVWENMKNELSEIEEKLERFPTHTDLIDMERFDLTVAMKHHGGITQVRKKMNAQRNQMRGENSFVKNPDLFDDYTVMLIRVFGTIPTHAVLKNLPEGRHYAYAAYHLYKGINNVRAMNGLKIIRMGPYSLRIWENFENELKKLIGELGGIFPPSIIIEARSDRALAHAIQYHGGYHKVKEKMGFGSCEKPKKRSKATAQQKQMMKKLRDDDASAWNELLRRYSGIIGRLSGKYRFTYEEGVSVARGALLEKTELSADVFFPSIAKILNNAFIKSFMELHGVSERERKVVSSYKTIAKMFPDKSESELLVLTASLLDIKNEDVAACLKAVSPLSLDGPAHKESSTLSLYDVLNADQD